MLPIQQKGKDRSLEKIKKESILSVHARAFLEEQAGDCCIQPCSVAAVSASQSFRLATKI